jgi:UDP-N-acetylmuramate--alanine ligase
VTGTELQLEAPRSVHIVGIGGAGMSAIALVLARMGHAVTGSDLKDSRVLERLRAMGVTTHVGHDAGNLPPGVEAVVTSTAIPATNVEVEAARARGVPVFRRADALRAIVSAKSAVAVAGSHGKTTTASMLALVLRAAERDPSFVIGGELNEVGTNAAWGDGDVLVVEADESDGTFLELAPRDVIVTSVLPDHLDHYGGYEALADAFRQFVAAVPGICVICADDPVAGGLLRSNERAVTYGFDERALYRAIDYHGGRAGTRFRIVRAGEQLGAIELPVPGRHNASNATAAAAMAVELGVAFETVASALGAFGGVARRFQFRGEVEGVTFVDDYAHLPSDVVEVIRAAREGGWERVIAVFQPHRYTRTAALWPDFADAFVEADTLVLTDVYPAGEQALPGVSAHLVLRAVLDAHPDAKLVYLPRHGDLVAHVPRLARAGDLVLTLGAGDLTSLPDEWLAVD